MPAAYWRLLCRKTGLAIERVVAAGVPDEVIFGQTQIDRYDEIDGLLADGRGEGSDPADGRGLRPREAELRDAIAERGNAVRRRRSREEMTVQLPGQKGCRAYIAVGDLARELPKSAWRSLRRRHGTKVEMRSTFALMRVRAAREGTGAARRAARLSGCFMLNKLTTEAAPIKFWLCNLPAGTRGIAKINETSRKCVGGSRKATTRNSRASSAPTTTPEGRGWLGFHHHGALCIAAYAFLNRPSELRLSPHTLYPSSDPPPLHPQVSARRGGSQCGLSATIPGVHRDHSISLHGRSARNSSVLPLLRAPMTSYDTVVLGTGRNLTRDQMKIRPRPGHDVKSRKDQAMKHTRGPRGRIDWRALATIVAAVLGIVRAVVERRH